MSEDAFRYWHYDLDDGTKKHPLDSQLEAEAGKLLCDNYPKAGISWYIEANHRTGLLRIEVPELHREGNKSWGFVISLDDLTDAGTRRKKVVWAGGELLERAYKSRTTDQRTVETVDRG